MLILARREQTNGNQFLDYSKLFLESLFKDVSVSICQISMTDHPGHVVFLLATYLPAGEKMLQRYITKWSPGTQYKNFTPNFHTEYLKHQHVEVNLRKYPQAGNGWLICLHQETFANTHFKTTFLLWNIISSNQTN